MSHETLEVKIKQLDRRVTRLEKATKPSFSSLFSRISLRSIAWFVLTVFSLLLLREWWLGTDYSLIIVAGVLIGGLLIIQSSSWFGVADSTKQLLAEAGMSRPQSAHHFHKLPHASQRNAPSSLGMSVAAFVAAGCFFITIALVWALFTYVTDPAAQITALLAVPTLGMLYALRSKSSLLVPINGLVIYILLALAPGAPLVVLAYLVVGSLVLTLWSAQTKHWRLQVIATAGTFLVLGKLALTSTNPGIEAGVLLASLVCCVGFSLPFLFHRREVGERRLIRATLFMVSGYVAILPLLLVGYVSYHTWILALLLCIFIFTSFTAVSLARFGRFSYAKYYGLALVVLLMISSTILGTAAIATLSWLILSILLLTLGFFLNSYTARMAGFGVLLLSFLLYATTIFPSTALVVGPVIVLERVWVGLIFAAFCIVAGLWYKDYPVAEQEALQRPLIVELLYLVALAIIGGLIWLGLGVFYQSLAWVIVGLLFLAWGRRQGSVLLQATAIAVTVVSLSKLMLVDSNFLTPLGRVLLLLVIGFLLIVTGLSSKVIHNKS